MRTRFFVVNDRGRCRKFYNRRLAEAWGWVTAHKEYLVFRESRRFPGSWRLLI